MRTALSRALIGPAIAATALLTAVGTAGAATVRTPTHLSIAESATSITVGQRDIVTGTLTANGKPLAKHAVILDKFYRHRWHPIAAKATNREGNVAFYRRPRHTTSYRLVYLGNHRYARAHSSAVHVTVTKVPTALAATESATSITAGQKDTITGTLTKGSKPVMKKVVWIYRLVTGHKPQKVQAHLTNRKGKVFFKVKPKVTTSYKLVFFGSKTLARSVSAVITVTVTH